MDEKLQALVSQLLNEGKSEEEIRDFIRQYKEEYGEELAFSADWSGFDLGKSLYTQAAFFVGYEILLSIDAQKLIKDYLFCKTFNCPPNATLQETSSQIKDDFLIIDNEYNTVKNEKQKQIMKDKN